MIFTTAFGQHLLIMTMALGAFGLLVNCRHKDDSSAARSAIRSALPTQRPPRAFALPVRELSGLCQFQDASSGKRRIVAINDLDRRILSIDLDLMKQGRLKFEENDLAGWPGVRKPRANEKPDSQWEAVFADQSGRLYISNEEMGSIEMFDLKNNRALGQIEFVIPTAEPAMAEFKKAWDQDKSSRVEGFIILEDGHILAAKEKNPPALIEFGPPGESAKGFSNGVQATRGQDEISNQLLTWPGLEERKIKYEALKIWNPAKDFPPELDLSELTLTERGELALLSDRLRKIYIIGDKLAPKEKVFQAIRSVDLVQDMEKPEGLVFVGSNQAVIGLDLKEMKPNIFLQLFN